MIQGQRINGFQGGTTETSGGGGSAKIVSGIFVHRLIRYSTEREDRERSSEWESPKSA